MFEKTSDHFTPNEGAAAGELQAIAWPALVARLAAQRDLCRVLLSRDGRGQASFNAGAAAWLAQSTAAESGKRDVNLDALADRKQDRANTAGAANGAAEGDRETL